MARYKIIDTSPRFLAVDRSRQLLPGTFEHALNELLDYDIDLSDLDSRYSNDETGATAYPPAMLLKVILFAYSQGIVSGRAIERACREQVTFIALSGDSTPHFTTIADFVSTLGEDITKIFTQVLLRAKLVLKEFSEPSGIANQSAECRPAYVVIVKMHPSALIAPNQRPGYHETLDKIHQRMLLQIPLRVISIVRYQVSKFLRCNCQGLQYMLANV